MFLGTIVELLKKEQKEPRDCQLVKSVELCTMFNVVLNGHGLFALIMYSLMNAKINVPDCKTFSIFASLGGGWEVPAVVTSPFAFFHLSSALTTHHWNNVSSPLNSEYKEVNIASGIWTLPCRTMLLTLVRTVLPIGMHVTGAAQCTHEQQKHNLPWRCIITCKSMQSMWQILIQPT